MIKFFAYLATYCFYPFSFLFFRKNKKWAFGSFRGAFNDNAKYLFIYVSQNVPDIEAIWLSYNKATVALIRQKGLRAYNILSPKGAWHALTSKFWFFNAYTSDIMFCFSGGATCVNLWHGVGLKRCEFNITDGILAKRFIDKNAKEVFYHPESFRRPDFFVSSTPFQTSMCAKAFRISENQCWELGYPRNEILLSAEETRQKFIANYEPKETTEIINKIVGYNKTFIYMPTWRESQRDILKNLDLNKLNTVLKEKQQMLIFKPHTNSKIMQSPFEGLTNILLLPNTIDIYTILPYTHVLITDYSSILYDYILMDNKDVVLYLYDFDDYIKERDFYYPFHENVVGKQVYTFDELLTVVRDGDYSIDQKQRQTIKDKFWGSNYLQSSQRIISKSLLIANGD